MKKNYYWWCLMISALPLVSCSKFLEEKVISGVSYQLYETEKGVEGAVTAAYSTLRMGVSGERSLTFSDAGTDLFTLGSDGNQSFNQYLSTLSSLEGKVSDYWNYHYKGISECNVALNYLPKVEMQEDRKAVLNAEARFLRAIYYFDLVQQYGKVPLVLVASSEVTTSYTRAEVHEIYGSIIADLAQAYEQLPVSTEPGRATKAAAAHQLSKVYLARASATTDKQVNIRGTKPTDLDSVIYYSSKIVNKELGSFSLVQDYAKLFDINNPSNSEAIFTVQFTSTPLNNGSGNQQHLYHTPQYDAINTKILARSIEYGRPYRRVRPTPYVYNGLFGATRKYDSRFAKSFFWAYLANKAANGITTLAGNKVDVKVGDTAVYFTPELHASDAVLAGAIQQNNRLPYYVPLNTYLPFSMNFLFPGLKKWNDPLRTTTNETNGSRDWMLMRYAETLLILAEAYGRKGDYESAAALINQVRERAAYKEGELKTTQYWTFEGGDYNDRYKSTVTEMKIDAASISSNFIDVILEERGREMLGELNRWEDLVRCEKLVERVRLYNPDAGNIRDYHNLRPIPQTHIDRLDPAGPPAEEQNEGYY